MTGLQALVRLPMAQMRRDREAGLDTARSSPGIAARRSAATTSSWSGPPHLDRARRHVPAGRQRGPRGHRRLGQPAAAPVAGRAQGRRGRHLVRQGAGGRPLGRRAEACQRRRLLAARRRALPRRRRPLLQVLVDPAPVRPCLHVGADAGALPILDPRVPGDGAARHRHVALFRLLGRDEVHLRHRRNHRRRRPCRRARTSS
jgi:hypothetical protein